MECRRRVIPVTLYKLLLLYYVAGCYSQKIIRLKPVFLLIYKELAMNICRSMLLFLTLVLAGTAQAAGDVLLIDSIKSAPQVDTPRNGLTMDQVRQQYGEPASTVAAVGEPPISRWEYTGFSVFFENNLVLHSVTQHPVNK